MKGPRLVKRRRPAGPPPARNWPTDRRIGWPDTWFIDIFPAMLRPDGMPDAALFGDDMLHMNPAGYARWTATLRPTAQAIKAAA